MTAAAQMPIPLLPTGRTAAAQAVFPPLLLGRMAARLPVLPLGRTAACREVQAAVLLLLWEEKRLPQALLELQHQQLLDLPCCLPALLPPLRLLWWVLQCAPEATCHRWRCGKAAPSALGAVAAGAAAGAGADAAAAAQGYMLPLAVPLPLPQAAQPLLVLELPAACLCLCLQTPALVPLLAWEQAAQGRLPCQPARCRSFVLLHPARWAQSQRGKPLLCSNGAGHGHCKTDQSTGHAICWLQTKATYPAGHGHPSLGRHAAAPPACKGERNRKLKHCRQHHSDSSPTASRAQERSEACSSGGSNRAAIEPGKAQLRWTPSNPGLTEQSAQSQIPWARPCARCGGWPPR